MIIIILFQLNVIILKITIVFSNYKLKLEPCHHTMLPILSFAAGDDEVKNHDHLVLYGPAACVGGLWILFKHLDQAQASIICDTTAHST